MRCLHHGLVEDDDDDDDDDVHVGKKCILFYKRDTKIILIL